MASNSEKRRPRAICSTDAEKFPTRLAFSVWIVQLYNGIQYSEIFTLAVYVVRRFEGESATEQRIGQLAGLLAAASSFAVGVGAWPWGLFSDRIGRKPVILIGNCATAACIILFSSASTYWLALFFRLLAGILDGSLVITKVMVSEMCSPSMQAQVMSYLALGDAMGNIIGPALGGLLADPCARFSFIQASPLCNETGLFNKSPFLLPCAVTAALGVLTTLTNILTMEETLPRLRCDNQSKYEILSNSSGEVERSLEPKEGSLDTDTPVVSELMGHPQMQDVILHSSASKGESGGLSLGLAIPGGGLQTGDDEDHHAVAIEMQTPRSAPLQPHDSVQSTYGTQTKSVSSADDWEHGSDSSWRVELQDEQQLLLGTKQTDDDTEKGEKAGLSKDSDEPWWKNRPLVLTLIVTAWMLSIAKYNDELGPVFVSAPVKQGGLGMPLNAFALPLSIAGIVLTLYAMFGYPWLQRAVGLKMTCSLGLLLGIPGDLVLPTAAWFLHYPILEQATIFVAIVITKLTTQTAFTSSMVIINSLAPRSQLGSVNGIRMMLAAMGRSSGPLLGGALWGLSASLHFPGHHYIGFLVASVALVGCWGLHHRIPINIAS